MKAGRTDHSRTSRTLTNYWPRRRSSQECWFFARRFAPSESKPCQPPQDASKTLPSCSDQSPPFPPYREGLIVFVVSENPTGGINLEQFHNALAWVQAVQAASQPPAKEGIRILGPYFSGSFPSLAQALRADSPVESNKTITIFSGTVSSKPGIDWFTRFLGDSPNYVFYSFQENDDVMIDRYLPVSYRPWLRHRKTGHHFRRRNCLWGWANKSAGWKVHLASPLRQ